MKSRWEKLVKKYMTTLPGEKYVYRPNKGLSFNILLGGGEFGNRSQTLDPSSPSGYCSPVDTLFDIAFDISQDDYLIVYKFIPDISMPNIKHTHHIPWDKIVDIIISERIESKERSYF